MHNSESNPVYFHTLAQRVLLNLVLLFILSTGAAFILSDFLFITFSYDYSFFMMGIVLVMNFLVSVFNMKA